MKTSKKLPTRFSRTCHGISCRHYEVKSTPLHWHDFYEIELITSGTGTHKINGKSYEWKRGELHFLRPIDFHEIQLDDNSKSTVHLIQIGSVSLADDIKNFLDLNCPAFVTYLNEDEFLYADALCRMLKDYVPLNTENEISDHILHLITRLFFSKLNTPTHDTSSKSSLINNITLYISENFRGELTLKKIADNFYITPNYLCMYFKKHMNQSPTTYIKTMRLNYSAKLVSETNLTSTEICYACGYGSISNFLRDFKKLFGISPLEMRKQLRKN